MQVKRGPAADDEDRRERDRATFTNAARRAQIVDAAIETIADLGYAGASFARIADRAGLSSTRLISYHFAGKDDLTAEVLRMIQARFADVVRPKVAAQTTARGNLNAFLDANIEFLRTNRSHLVSMVEIARSASLVRRIAPADRGRTGADLAGLEQLLREGQRSGEFGEFDPAVLAVFVLSLRNAVVDAYARRPDLDLDAYARELRQLVNRATAGPATR
ncbi:TetR/AcrR family transcriptional regulator [Actinopolymorpha singaporensis]